MWQPEVVDSSGVSDMNARSVKIAPVSRICCQIVDVPAGFARSGTANRTIIATTNVTAAMATNTSRQPKTCVAHSIGAVATSRPIAPEDITRALASARRGSLTQITTALKLAISPPAKPRPINARATTSVPTSWPNANTNAPTAATVNSAACTRRGPNRSSRTPSGGWNNAKAAR